MKAMMSYLDTGSGFPVLLGHSYLFDKSMWAPQIEALAKQFRVIAPDLWGHGDSPNLPASTTSLADLAADHLALMDALQIEEFAVVGLSVGGMWGAELAAAAPQRVKALMLFDTFIGDETCEARERYFGMLNAIETTGFIPPAMLDYIIGQFYSQHATPADVQRLSTYLSSLTAEQLRGSIVPLGKQIFGRPDRLSVLNTIRCPAHVATGELDRPRPPVEGRLMAEKLSCDFTQIPNAAHISSRENPVLVLRLIEDFLSRHL
ncbi:Pimeloyl-ACP methyl ester carboxylesterase [Kosakonia arachidis]|uniref:Pimeloyl-ACP methyl ester carboxylesterase n=1 Tax=Kosakonia arachidis TaxID=551989 RepID=A0A1I6ZEP3_9ENTR|nr:alpha/beta fold hydrolase [Kosakonia arachidis]SFT61190.1 Pimeloyl-ACP methyl ester carboxylesterase [Kosakonia arachidis]